ncbi:unnamed protein product [Prunus armeniaca]
MLLLVIHRIIALTGNGIQRGAGMARVRGIFLTDKIQFSGQIVHGVLLHRVAGQGVKDLDGLSFLIGCDVAQFTRQDFCLITRLCFGEVPKVSNGESDEIRLQKRYFIDEGVTCNAVEEAFLRCTEEDDIYKLALVYFAELVVLGRDKHLNINLNYLTLVEDLDAVNRYPWGSMSFEKTQDNLFSTLTKYVKSFEEGRGKGKSKVTGTSRRNEKGKKDKHGEVQRGGWSFKGFMYAFQIWVYELIPRMVDLNYCKDRPVVVSAESIPSSCADLDELNKALSLLRSELFQVKREKDVLQLKVIRMEKNLDHCLGPHFEQEVRREIALLKEWTNHCVVSHLFKGHEEVDDMQWDEGPSNRMRERKMKRRTLKGVKGKITEMRERKRKRRGLKGVKGQVREMREKKRKRRGLKGVKCKENQVR